MSERLASTGVGRGSSGQRTDGPRRCRPRAAHARRPRSRGSARGGRDRRRRRSLRRGDAVRIGRQHVRDGVATISTEKTGMTVTIPILPALQEILQAGPSSDLAFICGERGQPLIPRCLQCSWRQEERARCPQDRCDQGGEQRRYRCRARSHLRLGRWPYGLALHPRGRSGAAGKGCHG